MRNARMRCRDVKGRLGYFLAALIVTFGLAGTPVAVSVASAAPAAAAVAVHRAAQADSLGSTIASIAEGQEGVEDNPASTYCNKYSAHWVDGTKCSNGNRAIEWCADFAAWTWQRAGVSFTYGSGSSDINASASSFYHWAVAHGTWHAAGSGYTPQPGDVAVYGSSGAAAAHVGVVVGNGSSGPNVVNGDWEIKYPSQFPTAVYYQTDESSEAGVSLAGYASPPAGVSSGSPILTSSSSLHTPDGYIHVFSGNSTGSVWETWFGNGHSPTSDLLGTPTGSPITSVSSMYTSDGYIHVFAGMQSGAIYEFYFGNGNAPKWDLLGNPDGQPITSVSSMQTSDGYIHVFSSTKDGYVWETYFGNGNAPKTDQLANLSGSGLSAITSLRSTDGYIHVFSGNVTGSVWETWFGNGHSPTSDLLGTPDGSAITSVSSMQTSDGYIHIFSTTADGYVWETYFGNGNAPKTDQLANLSG